MILREKNTGDVKTDAFGRPKRPPGLLGIVCGVAIVSYILYWVKGDEVRPPVYDTSSAKVIRKTIQDSVFSRDDIIRLPDFTDSSRAIADFISSHKNMKFEFSVHMSPTDTSSYTRSLEVSQNIAERNCASLIGDLCVDSLQLVAKGYGMLLPLSSEEEIEKAKLAAEKEKLEKINRRCELKVLSVK